MPGTGKKGSMFMRFRVQYYSRTDKKWHNIVSGADSGWVRVGSTRHAVSESGWSFTIAPPPNGSSYVLRGSVAFEWRRNGKAFKRSRKFTKAGYKSARGADPRNFTASICEIV
jgi:hypothetical protein